MSLHQVCLVYQFLFFPFCLCIIGEIPAFILGGVTFSYPVSGPSVSTHHHAVEGREGAKVLNFGHRQGGLQSGD
jgi:hypothetical protein